MSAKNPHQPLTHVWQKWRCSTPLDIYCYIQHSFSASAFVVKIATFAKRGNVKHNFRKKSMEETDRIIAKFIDNKFKAITSKEINSFDFLFFKLNKGLTKAFIIKPKKNDVNADISDEQFDIFLSIIDDLNNGRVDFEAH